MVEGKDFMTNTREIECLDFEHPAYDQMIPIVVDYTDRDDFVPLKQGDTVETNRVLDEIHKALDYYHNKYPNRLVGELKINLDNDGYVVDYYAPAKATVDFNNVENEDHDPLDLENDKEKLIDFIELSPDEFLNSYSYLSEDVYVATCQKYGLGFNDNSNIKRTKMAEHGLYVDDAKYKIKNVTDEAIMRHGRELANFPKFTHNKNGEAVGLSNDEAKFLEKRNKEDVFKEAKESSRECGVGGVARPECLHQEVR